MYIIVRLYMKYRNVHALYRCIPTRILCSLETLTLIPGKRTYSINVVYLFDFDLQTVARGCTNPLNCAVDKCE